MNAETTHFKLGPKEGPNAPVRKNEDNTHLYLIDDSKPDGDSTKIAKFSLSQLYSYSEHAWKGFRWAQGCGYKAVPRRIINNLRDVKPYFTGQEDIYKGKKGTDGANYEKTFVTVLSSEEFDDLFVEFNANVNPSVKMEDYDKDDKDNDKNRAEGIAVFRKLLNSTERIENLMKLMAGVMYGGANKNQGLWNTYRGFFQFILTGIAEDYKKRSDKRAKDPEAEAELEFPHLTYSALAKAILDANVNLTVKNTVETAKGRRGSNASVHQRRGSNASSNGEKKDMDYASLAHMLKWCLVLGQIEQTFTPALYEKLCQDGRRPYTWSAYNVGTFIRVFGMESLGTIPKQPEPKTNNKGAKKGPGPKKTAKAVAKTTAPAPAPAPEKPADEEAVESEDDESEDEEDAPAAEKEESDDEEEEDSDDEPEPPAAKAEDSDDDDEDDEDNDEEEE